MTKHKNNDLEINQVITTASVFIESYNKAIPDGFPKASIKLMNKFQFEHPTLFKSKNEWSIDKHRKKLMDWLVSHQDILEN